MFAPEPPPCMLTFAGGNEHFFLNLGMAACKAALDAAHGVADSSLVTAMARNGTEFGIRVSGLGERWFTGPAEMPVGLYFAGFGPEDANPDMGDSAITETAGLGGFAARGIFGQGIFIDPKRKLVIVSNADWGGGATDRTAMRAREEFYRTVQKAIDDEGRDPG